MKISKRTLIGLVIIIVGGCGPIRTWRAHSEVYDRPGANHEPPFLGDQYAQDIATRFGLMALFSELVYMRHLGEDRSGIDECDISNSNRSNDSYEVRKLPYDLDTGERWVRWREEENDRYLPCVNEKGLFYDTFVLLDFYDVPKKAVIAFRGTENRSGERIYDWKANFSAFFGFDPDQYRIARNESVKLIDALLSINPSIEIYSTGHSLGGGLAQQLGYVSKNVKEVVTFNTSPVTNWTNLRFEGSVENEYPIIYRIYHGGEILEKVRFITTNVTSTQFGRHDISVQFEPRSDFAGHSMEIITCALAKLIAGREEAEPDAMHSYRKIYVRNELFGKDGGSATSETRLMCSKVG